MSKATFVFGRFNPPHAGHGRVISAVKSHAEKVGGSHYVFPSHSQDRKKNPLSHDDKVGVMKKMFPETNIVTHSGVNTPVDAMKHLEKKGHTHVTMVVGSDRVKDFHKLLHSYNGKEYNFKKITVRSGAQRDPDAQDVSGMSSSKLRKLAKAGKRDEFISHYSDKKLGAHIHNKVNAAMNESKKVMFVLGGPGSGKDYVINNILSRFNLIEVQLDQVLNGAVNNLVESNASLLINGNADMDKITLVKSILEGYEFAHTIVSVSNKVSRERNESHNRPLNEQVRIRKWLNAENIASELDNMFVFKNSINLKEATQSDLMEFQKQIESYLKFLLENDLTMEEYVRINSPKHKDLHGKSGRVFYRHPDGRVNVQVTFGAGRYKDKRTGEREPSVYNYTLRPDQVMKVDEVLEWGTTETTDAFKAATPGQVILKPKLTVRKFKKKLVVPPSAFNSRVGGVSSPGQFSQDGSVYTGGSYSGGLVSSYEPKGDVIEENKKK